MKKIIGLTTSIFLSICVLGQTKSDSARTDSAGKFNQTLKAVTVQGSKPFIQRKAGKIILNVAESPIAAGGNASDVIAHIPGADGLQFHGRTMLVLIDGRNTGLKGNDLRTILDGIAAGTIDRVELIETPSAKYDASGGVVLNIITIKAKKAGANGTLSSGLGAGRYMKYTEGGTINYRSGKVNLYAGYDYLHGKPFYDNYSDRRVDSFQKIIETTNGTRNSDNHSFRAGMDYEIDKRRSFGLLFKGMYNVKHGRAVNQSLLTNSLTGEDSLSMVTTNGRSRYFIPSANAWYKMVFDSSGRELNINADFLHYGKTWNEDFVTRYYNNKGTESADPSLLRDQSPAGNTILSLSADYTYPLAKGRFETGVKTSYTRTDNDIRWEYDQNGNWAIDNGKSNHFIYSEHINAIYTNYERSWKKLMVSLGLRAEQTLSKGESITLNRVDEKNYVSLFPNAGLQYTLGGDQQLSLSYRRGIERFGFDVVNPFVRYISQYSYAQGNPNIRPSTSQNFDLSYSWKGELVASVSYQHYLDALGTVYQKADAGNAVISTETNMGSADQFETDLSWTKTLWNGKWTTSNSATAMYAKYNMLTDSRQPGAKWTAMLSTDNMFNFGKGWKLQMSAMYYSPFLLGVYSFRSRFSADMGISKTVLQNKGKVSLNVSDIFNSYVNRYDLTSYGISSYNRQKSESQVVRLVFSYRFGGKAQKNAAAKKSGIEDLKQRLGGN